MEIQTVWKESGTPATAGVVIRTILADAERRGAMPAGSDRSRPVIGPAASKFARQNEVYTTYDRVIRDRFHPNHAC